jgi:hypothetical protein
MPASGGPSWIADRLDQERVTSYGLYEQIYWGVPQTFKLVARAVEDKPIYLPSGMTIINTTARFTAPKPSLALVPSFINPATAETISAANDFWNNFFKRERFWSKFTSNKLYGLMRGDWVWQLYADPLKPPGSRVSIRAVDPGTYFPIFDENDLDKIVGVHVVDMYADPKNSEEILLKRSTYRRPLTAENPGQWVSYEVTLWEVDPEWGVAGTKTRPKQVLTPVMELPGITSIPLYHTKNFEEPQNPFGSSDLRGFERIIAAVNQSISDEDLALALEGLGVYATDAPNPTDDEGNELPWELGPGSVVGYEGGKSFQRVSGVGSVGPFQEHIALLMKNIKEGSNTPDIAIGSVDVSVAESGVARALQFAPMLSKAEAKEELILGTHDQMLYDLATQWFPTYEQVRFDGMAPTMTFGDKMPTDRAATRAELDAMLDRQVISTAFYRAEMTRLFGIQFPANMEADIQADQDRIARAADPFGARVDDELANEGLDIEVT